MTHPITITPGEAYIHKRTHTIAVCSVADDQHALFWIVLNGRFCISERMSLAQCNEVLNPYNPLIQGKLNNTEMQI